MKKKKNEDLTRISIPEMKMGMECFIMIDGKPESVTLREKYNFETMDHYLSNYKKTMEWYARKGYLYTKTK